MTVAPRFALNHMAAPRLPLPAFFGLAASLGIREVEIRNDLPGTALLDGTPPAAVREAAALAGVTVIALNALQRFDDWTTPRANEAVALADYAAAGGVGGLVLVPVNDGCRRTGDARRDALRRALEALGRILADRRVVGLVEPLGFTTSSLRSKREAAAAIAAVGAPDALRLVHDTFHHAVAGEPEIYPELTGLVHLSGVPDAAIALRDLEDRHRELVGPRDRLNSVGQARMLLAQGYAGPLSFEPFAPALHAQANPERAIAESVELVRHRLLVEAA